MNSITLHIPNFLTCCNLLCGCLGIIQVFRGNYVYGAYFVFLGGAFDFFDGLAARIFKAHSPIGKDLDSLADIVTFGLLPGLMMYQWLGLYSNNLYLPNFALLIPVFSALRLAKFNNDPRQSSDFLGLPTPANAIFFVSLPLVYLTDKTNIGFIFQNPLLITILIIFFCALMVSEIKLFSFKINGFQFAQNVYLVVFIVLANLMFFLIGNTAIPFIIILYLLLSLFKNYILSYFTKKIKAN
jgi:CDP-diacylglycerol---serine O-phosphatidyltransferase